MNKIIIDNNKIETFGDTCISIFDNNIKFLENGECELEIKGNSNLEFNVEVLDNVVVKLFMVSVDGELKNKISYKLGEGSNLLLFKFYNNKRVDLVEDIYLEGKYSSISYNFSSICDGVENYKIRVFHNNCYVTSNISNKCIGNDNSKIVFDIDSILDTGNIGCSMNQDTKVMCMGDVDASISPNMYIEEDDVEARHGSVIGKFRDEDLFYLMSRGINYEDSVKLLIKGFILSNLVLNMENQARVLKIINQKYD